MVSTSVIIFILATRSATAQFSQAVGLPVVSSTTAAPATAAAASSLPSKDAAQLVEKIPEFASFGPLFRSSKVSELTEVDVAEYVVTCIRHTFPEHVVFQASLAHHA
jgi:coatomer protein complex subunit gamma